MTGVLIWGSGIVLAVSMAWAYVRARDPMHPLVFLVPMFFYIYVLIPGAYFHSDELPNFFPDSDRLDSAMLYTALALSCFCMGCLKVTPSRSALAREHPQELNPIQKRRLRNISYAVCGVGVGVYVLKLMLRGGLVASYSSSKGGGGKIGTGYLDVAPLLTLAALVLYLLSRKGRRLDLWTGFFMAICVAPHLIQSLLGGSRGATFLAFAAIPFSWYLATGRRPPAWAAVVAILLVGVLMLYLKAHRRERYIGSEKERRDISLSEIILPADTKGRTSDPSLFSLGLIVACIDNNHYYRGLRYFGQLIVRPIPRQLWKRKYQDIGLSWMVDSPGSGGMTPGQWRNAVGWSPAGGTSTGIVADTFLEFGWGGLIVCSLVGALFGYLWRKAVQKGRAWVAVYLAACVASVYLPTQGLTSAWAFRFIYLAVPAVLLWRVSVGRGSGLFSGSEETLEGARAGYEPGAKQPSTASLRPDSAAAPQGHIPPCGENMARREKHGL